MPGAWTYMGSAPSSAIVPQPSQRARALVSSSAKISPNMPAAALPSSLRSASSMSTSCRSEAFGLDAVRIVAHPDERVRDALDEPRRAADVDARPLLPRPGHLAEHPLVDPARVARPALGLRARERVHDLDAVVRRKALELVTVDDLVERARGIKEPKGSRVTRRDPVTEHRHQRHHARSAGDEQHRPADLHRPDEVAADWAPQLELVARLELADEVRRHLAVVEALDREHEVRVLGSRCDRVAPLGLVAVLSRQPNVDVLAGTVARPLRRVEDDAANSRRLVDEFDDVRELPRQSPQYRCSRHGSP